MVKEYSIHDSFWVKATVLKRIGVNMNICKTIHDKIIKRHIDQIILCTTPFINKKTAFTSEPQANEVVETDSDLEISKTENSNNNNQEAVNSEIENSIHDAENSNSTEPNNQSGTRLRSGRVIKLT